MTIDASAYRGYRYPAEIISHAVWLYHRFCLSFRDVEDLLGKYSGYWRKSRLSSVTN
jgi:putative transposase